VKEEQARRLPAWNEPIIDSQERTHIVERLQEILPESFLEEKCRTEDQVCEWFRIRVQYAKIAEVMRNDFDGKPFPEVPPLNSPDYFHIHNARVYLYLYMMLKQAWLAIEKKKRPDWFWFGRTPAEMLVVIMFCDAVKQFSLCQKYTELSPIAIARKAKFVLEISRAETLSKKGAIALEKHRNKTLMSKRDFAHRFCIEAITTASRKDRPLATMLKAYYEIKTDHLEQFVKKRKHLGHGIGFHNGNRTKSSLAGYVRDTDYAPRFFGTIAEILEDTADIDL
jgi:hypothetical protein